jgi:hypothetical protein
VRTRCCQIVYFPGESAQRRKREMHPANAIVGTGRVGKGREKGGGVVLARVTASFLGEGTRCLTMEIAPWCGAIYFIFGRCGSIFTPWGRQTPSFCNVVARASDTPVPLRRQNRERNLASWRKISHRGQFRLRWCSTKLAREGVSVHK